MTPTPRSRPSQLTCTRLFSSTFTYADCAGNSHVCTYTYTIDIPDFTMPADEATTVECPADATPPTPPPVVDACGNTITPTPGTAPSPLTCEGDMVYTFTYADCAGKIGRASCRYSIDIPDVTVPAEEAYTVAGQADATQTTAPTDADAVGDEIH